MTTEKRANPFSPKNILFRRMESANPLFFAGQHQQSPAPAEGNIIKTIWLKYYTERPRYLSYSVISCDLTFKDSGTSWVVFGYYGKCKHTKATYLLDQRRGKWDFVKSLKELQLFIKLCPPVNAILIEDKANGPAMVSVLKGKVQRVIAVEASKSKVERLSAESTQYEAGEVFYPDESICYKVPVSPKSKTKVPWIRLHVAEMITFPNAANDDRVDVESMALKHMREKANNSGITLLEDFINVWVFKWVIFKIT